MTTEITIPAGAAPLAGALSLPERGHGWVLFVHRSGSSRHSPRNQFVARTLNNAGLATLLFDLLTSNEERIDSYTAEFRFNIELLAERLSHATKWTRAQANTQDLGSVILARAPGPLALSSRRLNFLMSQPSCPAEAGLTSPETHYQRCGLQRYSSSGVRMR